jgi:DNA ligase-1
MIPYSFKPTLAVNYEKVKSQPQTRFCSEKIDGVRVIFFDGVAYSRALKPLPNTKLQQFAAANKRVVDGLDGEFVVGDLYDPRLLQKSVSAAMSVYDTSDFFIHVFDRYEVHSTWFERYCAISTMRLPSCMNVLPHYEMTEDFDLESFEKRILDLGGEGVMIRNAAARYKCGRSGVINPELQKVKRFVDEEFTVVNYAALERNDNEPTVNELGYTSRSSSKEGKVSQELLGSLELALPDGRTFWVGSGFTEEQRGFYWPVAKTLVGQRATVKYFKKSADGVPLLPSFRTIRGVT